MSDPYTNPNAYQIYTLDFEQPPGISWIKSGGERAEEFQDQQVPMTTGATTIFRFEPNGEITYTHKLWLPVHFDQWDAFAAMLIDGKNRRPRPRVYTLADERLVDVQMTTVGLKKLGPRMPQGRGRETLIEVTYKEVRRQKPYGGAAAPRDAVDPLIETAEKKAQAAKERLEAAQKAARAGK